MKVSKPGILAAVFLVFLFFLWGTYFHPQMVVIIHFPRFHIFFILFFILFILLSVNLKNKGTSLTELLIKYRYHIFPPTGFLLTLCVTFFVFQGIPHIQDSINYLVMADNFASGQLYHRMHDHYEFFSMLYLIPDGHGVHSLFMPGFSIFLAPFVFFGIPFIANPLLTAFNIFLSGKIAKELFDDTTSLIAMIFLLFSSFIIIMGGTFMAHPFCAAMTLSVVYGFIFSLKKGSAVFPVICGLAMGFLVLTRPQNALFLTIPLGVTALFYSYRDKTVIKKAVTAFIVFLPFLILLFIINYSYTGNILVFKQDIYFNYSEPGEFCHRFGIGSGCPNSNWETLPTEGLTWIHAFFITFKRLSPLIMNFLLHPLMMIFSIAGLLFFRKREHLIHLGFLFFIFLSTVSGYFFFYFDGNVFGPRYYYETSFLLMICTAYGFRTVISAGKEKKWLNEISRSSALSLFAASLYIHLFIVLPVLTVSYSNGFWQVDAKLRDSVAKEGISNAVVFVSPQDMYGSGFVLMNHKNTDGNDVIYARDLGESQNQRLFPYYPDRKFYLARFEKVDRNENPPVIQEIKPLTDPGIMRIQMEFKKYPLQGVPDYCNVFPERDYLDDYLSFKAPYNVISHDMKLFFCRFTSEDQFYTFGQYFYMSGNYKVTVSGLSGRSMGKFGFYVDDELKETVDFSGAGDHSLDWISFNIQIDKGLRMFKLKPVSMRSKPVYFFLDYIDFVIERN